MTNSAGSALETVKFPTKLGRRNFRTLRDRWDEKAGIQARHPSVLINNELYWLSGGQPRASRGECYRDSDKCGERDRNSPASAPRSRQLCAHGERRRGTGRRGGSRRATRRAAAQLSTDGLTAKNIASTEFLTSTWATGVFARRQLAQPIRSRTVSEWPIRGQSRSALFPDATAFGKCVVTASATEEPRGHVVVADERLNDSAGCCAAIDGRPDGQTHREHRRPDLDLGNRSLHSTQTGVTNSAGSDLGSTNSGETRSATFSDTTG
jgi:hypothetical protein